MSKAIYWQRGETIDYKNDTDALIEAGTIIVLGSRIGVAAADIPAGELGELNVDGVYKFPKAEDAVIDMGAAVEYDPSAGTVDVPSSVATQSDDDDESSTQSKVTAGFAVAPAASADTEVLVKINA